MTKTEIKLLEKANIVNGYRSAIIGRRQLSALRKLESKGLAESIGNVISGTVSTQDRNGNYKTRYCPPQQSYTLTEAGKAYLKTLGE